MENGKKMSFDDNSETHVYHTTFNDYVNSIINNAIRTNNFQDSVSLVLGTVESGSLYNICFDYNFREDDHSKFYIRNVRIMENYNELTLYFECGNFVNCAVYDPTADDNNWVTNIYLSDRNNDLFEGWLSDWTTTFFK